MRCGPGVGVRCLMPSMGSIRSLKQRGSHGLREDMGKLSLRVGILTLPRSDGSTS